VAEQEQSELVSLTAEIVAAYVSNNKVGVEELGGLIASVHGALSGAGQPEAPAEPETPKATAAQVRKSITPDALISFEDGKPYKTLKRHLTLRGLTMDQYREKWGLPKDYPSTAPNYSAQRSALAKSLGLGRKAAEQPAPEAPKGRGGRRKAAAQ
jgi:predicted transcriptional regulator